jgi:integrase
MAGRSQGRRVASAPATASVRETTTSSLEPEAPADQKVVRRPRRSFGKIRRLRSGRYEASYISPEGTRQYAPETYSARPDAEGWLRDERRLIEWDEWLPLSARDLVVPSDADQSPAGLDEPDSAGDARGDEGSTVTLGAYARDWIRNRVTRKGGPLHPRTRIEYLGYIDGILEPLMRLRIESVTATEVAKWHGQHARTPALRHKAYSFMSSVFRTAIEQDELIERNPCRVENATRKPKAKNNADKLVRRVSHDTVRQLAALVQPRDRALILMLAYCCVRSGEAFALRQRDIQLGVGADDMPFGWLTVERGISSYEGQRHEGETKTGEQGERVVPIPPHIVGELTAHLAAWAEPGPDGLVFPSTNPKIDFRTTQQVNGHAAVHRPDGSIRKKGYGWYHARHSDRHPLPGTAHAAPLGQHRVGRSRNTRGTTPGDHGPRPARNDRRLHPPRHDPSRPLRDQGLRTRRLDGTDAALRGRRVR